jgi:hypothetical protein
MFYSFGLSTNVTGKRRSHPSRRNVSVTSTFAISPASLSDSHSTQQRHWAGVF